MRYRRPISLLAFAALLFLYSGHAGFAAETKKAAAVKSPAVKDEALAPGREEKAADKGTGADKPPVTADPSAKNGAGKGSPGEKTAGEVKGPVAADASSKAAENEKKRLEWIERTLEFGISKERREAINLMLTLKDESSKWHAGPLLLKLLKSDTDEEVLVRAITVGGDLKLAELGPEFVRFLDDPTEDVRTAAVGGIHALMYAQAKDVLVKKLKEQDLAKDSNFTDSIIRTLADFKAGEAREFAEAGIKDLKTTAILREALILFLGKAGIQESRGFLIALLKDQDENLDMRSYAASALSLLGAKESAADINEVVKTIEAMPFKKRKEHYTLYIYCVSALVRLGDEGALPRLMESLKSDNSMVRIKAIKLMKDLKDKRTIDILKYKRDYDPSPVVQKAARDALEGMGVTDAKPVEKAADKPADSSAADKARTDGAAKTDADKSTTGKR